MLDVFEIAIKTVQVFGYILYGLIFARVILSWIPPLQRTQLAALIHALTEPILGPIRKLLAKSPLGGAGMPLDFSPLLAFLAIQLGQMVLIQLIVMLWSALN